MKHAVYGAILATVLAGGAHASVIDFETLPGGSTPMEGFIVPPLTYQFDTILGPNTNSATFTSSVGLGIAEVGVGPDQDPFGFFPADTPSPSDAFGSFFLTSALQTVSDLTITYLNPISGLNFDLGDVDGLQQGASNVEVFTVTFRDVDGNTIATRQVRGDQTFEGQPTGNQSVVNVSFDAGAEIVKSIFIQGTTVGGTRLIGIAFDNFDPDEPTDPSVIPVPPTLPLIAAGIGALALLRRRKTAA